MECKLVQLQKLAASVYNEGMEDNLINISKLQSENLTLREILKLHSNNYSEFDKIIEPEETELNEKNNIEESTQLEIIEERVDEA